MMHVLFDEDLVRITRPVGRRRRAAQRRTAFAPERTAPITGIAADDVRGWRARSRRPSARCSTAASASARRSSAGSRRGCCYALNVLTGHLDEVGGSMFTTPGVDPLRCRALLGSGGGFAQRRSRVRGLPEFGGELPIAVLAEEIETPRRRARSAR